MVGPELRREAGAMIEAQGLTKQLGGRTVVSDVSLRCEPGSVTGFLGPNGLSPSRNAADGAREPQTRRLVCARGGGPTLLGPAHQKRRTR